MSTTKSKFNKLVLTTMLILLAFLLCGCANINFVTYHNNDGSIQEYLFLNIDEQSLLDCGYNIYDVKNEIKSTSYQQASNLLREYHNRLEIEYLNQNISSNEYTALYNGVKVFEKDWNYNQYTIGLHFNSSSVYKKYYELLNNITFDSTPKQVKKLFYTKTYYYGTTNYGDYSIFNTIYNYYNNTVFASISPQDEALTYSYSVSSRRFHSDADKISLDNKGNYIHTWNVNPDKPARPICFYTISANRSVWILAGISTSITISIILCSIALIINLKHKKITKK